MRISEKQVLDAIKSVLMENRKVLKIGSSAPSVPPVSDTEMPLQDPGVLEPSGGDPSLAGGMDPSMQDPAAMNDSGEENQFDTNFDAGVEADEETDPKHYIQQLTGKLSQSINSFNSEQGPDAGLCKYVASMIIAATCKNLDEKAKKELIEKINTAASDDVETPDSTGSEGIEDAPADTETEQQPLMERILTKKELHELAFGVQDRQEDLPDKAKSNIKSIFGGKTFN